MSRHRGEKIKKQMEQIDNFLMKERHSLKYPVPKERFRKMLTELGMKKEEAKYALNSLRQIRGVKVERGKKVIKRSVAVQNFLVNEGLIRGSVKQLTASMAIINTLWQSSIIPYGGAGLIIGTSGPLFGPKRNLKSKNIFVDELMIAFVLQQTTNPPWCDKRQPIEIIVGNAKDEIKANKKVSQWRAIDVLYPIVDAAPVDRDTFAHHVTRLAEKHTLCKVILLTSGVWTCSNSTFREHGLDLNFAAPARSLTKIYRNLHILALCRNDKGSGYHVKYLNDGVEKVIEGPLKGGK